VGIEFLPTVFPLTHPPDLAGSVDVAGVAERRAGRWVALPSLAGWVAAAPGGELGAAGFVDTLPPHAPAGGGFRFDFNGTLLPLAHPPVPVPHALPAVAGPAVAAAAVDRLVTVDIPGGQLRLRVVGRSQLFPTVTDAPTQFLAVDYDTLFAALNVDSPGRAVASEAWFFAPKPRTFAAALGRPPFRLERAVGRRALETRLATDPLAAGTRRVLDVAAVVAAVLALLGLVLSTRATLAGERVLLAEQEALGIPPSTLRRAARARLLALCAIGVVAGLLGGIVALRLVAAFVAVAGTGAAPLPPIASAVAWIGSPLVVVGVLVVSAGAVGILVRQTFRESPAQRLRA
jgi:hypothetical protein